MGGVPCAKIIINGRLEGELNRLISESVITGNLLASKGFFESPILEEIIKYETELCEHLREVFKHFSMLIDKYAKETGYESS